MPKHIKAITLARFGSGLKRARAAKGISQRDLGDRTGLPQSHISKIEQGSVDLQLSSLVELARVLDLELKLVPRQVILAVDSIIQSVVADAAPAASRARAIIDNLVQRATDIQRKWPALEAAEAYKTVLLDLRLYPIDKARLTELERSLADASRLVELRESADQMKLLKQLTDKARRLRNSWADSAPSTGQVRAFRLDDDND